MTGFYKSKFIALFCVCSFIVTAQKVQTKNGEITFEASMPSFEEVKATSTNASCIINLETGELASLILIKSFRFKIALMQEHFNENYLESHLFPKAIFKGKIDSWSLNKLTSRPTKFILKGELEIHGVSNEIAVEIILSKNDKSINFSSQFVIDTDDYNIYIPKLVSNKVSKKVTVSLDYKLD